jgi:hypothetical protein
MNRMLKTLLLISIGVAFLLAPASPATAGPIHTGDQDFANPDELGDCPLAAPAFSGNVRWRVWYTSDPLNPAAALLTPGNPDTFTVVFEVTNDLLLSLPAECTGGPYNDDPNPGDLVKLNVGTFNLGSGDFNFYTPADFGTIDDGNPATPAPSSSAFTFSSVEWYFDAPNIDAGELTQKLFFTIKSIEPGEVSSFFVQSTSGSVDDEPWVPFPLITVPVEEMSWGVLKTLYR